MAEHISLMDDAFPQGSGKVSLNNNRKISPTLKGVMTDFLYSYRCANLPQQDPYILPTVGPFEGDSVVEDWLKETNIGTESQRGSKKLPEKSPTSNHLLLKALNELDQSLKEGNQQRMAEAWNSLGLVRLHTELNPREAIRCHENALQLLRSSSSSLSSSSSEVEQMVGTDSCFPLELATTFHDLGFCYERLKDTTHALELYQAAKRILTKEHGILDSYPRLRALERSIERLQRRL